MCCADFRKVSFIPTSQSDGQADSAFNSDKDGHKEWGFTPSRLTSDKNIHRHQCLRRGERGMDASPPSLVSSPNPEKFPQTEKGKVKREKFASSLRNPRKEDKKWLTSIFHWDFLMKNLKVFSKISYHTWFLAQTRKILPPGLISFRFTRFSINH